MTHDWYWMAETYAPNDDGETTTKRDYYECRECGETKVETTQLDWVQSTPEMSNPIAAAKMSGGRP